MKTIERLEEISCVRVPNLARVVRTGRHDFGSLRIECHFRNLSFVAYFLELLPIILGAFVTCQNGSAHSGVHIVDFGWGICWRCDESGSSWVEAEIQDLVLMASEGLYTFACADIPDFAGFVDRPCRAHFACELKLSRRNFSRVLVQSVDAFPSSRIPYLRASAWLQVQCKQN